MHLTDRDLDLAVELINTDWVLASPPDRLTDIGVYQRILRDAGEDALAGQLSPGDLAALRALRTQLKPVFAAPTVQAAVGVLDPLLRDAAVRARVVPSDGTARWDWAAGQQGMAALRSRLLAALATHLIRHGTARLGICQADPCTCVYVDHSRARTRRYCCDQCNDRAAAAAYRRRKSLLPQPVTAGRSPASTGGLAKHRAFACPRCKAEATSPGCTADGILHHVGFRKSGALTAKARRHRTAAVNTAPLAHYSA